MKFIAIASINKGVDVAGARMFDVVNSKVQDFTLEQLEHLINKGVVIRNITFENGKVTWSQGLASRYPVIDTYKPNIVSNINSIVVIGSYKLDTNTTKYIVANYEGKLATLDEDKLIAYGKQYTLANCKICTKDNKTYIASLSGEINTISTEAEFSYNKASEIVTVKLPIIRCTKLIIPTTIGGIEIKNPSKIQVKPMESAAGIIHMLLPNSISVLKSELFGSLPNLKVLECSAPPQDIHSSVFRYNRGITDIYLGGLTGKVNKLFGGLKYLKSIKFGVRPTSIQSSTFEDCTSLNTNDMIYEGLISIADKAFDGCTQLENVILPKSLKRLWSSAFKNCSNIKSLTISSSNLIIESDWDKTKGTKKDKAGFIPIKMLADSPDAVIYCPHSFPESLIKDYVSEHVRVIRSAPTEEDKNLSNKQVKALMVGINIRGADVATSAKEIIGFLTLIGDTEWRENLLGCVRAKLKDQLNNEEVYNIDCKGAHLQISLGNVSYWRRDRKYIKEAKVGKNYMYIIKKGELLAYLIDKSMIKGYVEEQIKTGREYAIRSNRYKDGFTEDNIFILKIPSDTLYVENAKISKIYEKDNKLIVEYKNGESEGIKLGQE